MEYPHRKYIKYLITKKYSSQEIQEDCLRLGLLVPLESDIDDLRDVIGNPPSTWRPNYESNNGYFNKWLRKKGVIDVWMMGKDLQNAINFLYKRSIRSDYETMIIAHGDLREAREQLLLKYPATIVPDMPALEKFYDVFWNVGSMSKDGIFDFLEKHAQREANLAALEGNLTEAYARTGIQQRVETVDFLNSLISFSYQQLQMARMSGEQLTGAALMGVAAITKQGMEATKQREEIENGGGIDALTSIREQVNAFKVRKISSESMLTIDQLEELENDEPRLKIVRN